MECRDSCDDYKQTAFFQCKSQLLHMLLVRLIIITIYNKIYSQDATNMQMDTIDGDDVREDNHRESCDKHNSNIIE